MKKNKIFGLAIIVTLPTLLGVYFLVNDEVLENEMSIEVIRYDDKYEPANVVITKGTTVEWHNQSELFHWPASDPHPSHSAYPEFDAQDPLAPGSRWSFTFDKVGEWGYHDHIRSNITGTIKVVE